ncbi:MAG: BrnT family toxin, partial [bacterium]
MKRVAVEFDPAKSEANVRARGLPFSLVGDAFDWSSALVAEDRRRDYAERRFQAIGYLAARLHVVVFTPIATGIRVISLRRANKREVKRYGQEAIPTHI